MKIHRFTTPGLAQYAYAVSSDGDMIVIDPMRDIAPCLAYAQENSLKLRAVLETHIHADYASGALALASATGAELRLSGHDNGEQFQYAMPHERLKDGDTVRLGKVVLRVLHTPGHTPEHISFLLFESTKPNAEPVAMFSGDFIFVGSLGRPDLLGEEAKHGLANSLFESMQKRIADLPDGLLIYPAHGAGSLCGASLGEREETTLGYERRTNPMFRLGRQEFVQQILASVPQMPTYYPRMKALNSVGAVHHVEVPGDKALSPQEVANLAGDPEVVVLDLRRPEAFGGAHVNGATNIGAGQNLPLWAGWLLDSRKKIVMISDQGDDAASRTALLRVGLDNIAGYVEGGMPAWTSAGLPFGRTQQLSVHDVSHRTPGSVVLDVRSPSEWKGGHIEGAVHIPLGDLSAKAQTLPQEATIITVCGSGYRSSIAASLLAQMHFAHVSSMDGGMTAWMRQKLPIS